MEKDEIRQVVDNARNYFLSGKTLPIEVRLENLNRLESLIISFLPKIYEAFKEDLNKHPFDVLSTEIYLVLDEIKYFKKHLRKLSKPKRVSTSIINFPSRGYLYQEPYGVILIMAPWNYPFQLAIEPLVGALAAGNTIILKPASYTPNVSKVIKDMLANFDEGLIYVITGGRNENQALLDQKFDYIFFTGGTTVGRLVLEKASVNLTPVTLELGGKSPCIVLKDCDLEIAAKRIVWGKFLNAGQTCVAPDYILVDETIHDEFIDKIKRYINKFYYNNNKLVDDFPKLVNAKHQEKILSLLDENKVIVGGTIVRPLTLCPTVMDDVKFHDSIMQEEIFGPILPIIKYKNISEVISEIKVRPKPLSCYIFSKNIKLAKRLMNELSFGGGSINETIMHLTNHNLPFGGVGFSGMGQYHGLASFKTFSHTKSVLVKKKRELNTKYPPHTPKKMSLLKKILGIRNHK